MVKILRENNQNFQENFKKILIKREMIDSSVDQVVENIIKKIKNDSDSGLLKLTQKYDNFKVSDVNQLFVQSEEIEKSKKMVDPKVLSSLKSAIKRIKDYHKRQIPKNDLFCILPEKNVTKTSDHVVGHINSCLLVRVTCYIHPYCISQTD